MSVINVTIELEPFPIPPYVVPKAEAVPIGAIQKQGTHRRADLVRYSLATLDEPTLLALCEEFTNSVFAAAGKTRPIT